MWSVNEYEDGPQAAPRDEQEFLRTMRHDLDDVEARLERLEAGSYGLCESCGQPIDEERLASLPTERFCVAHRRPLGPASGRSSER